ncbi:MAG: hypothetical protein QW153_03950, partial [Candidatus Bilamarchaeaceae archaeon]
LLKSPSLTHLINPSSNFIFSSNDSVLLLSQPLRISSPPKVGTKGISLNNSWILLNSEYPFLATSSSILSLAL